MNYEYEYTSETVGRFTVRVVADTDCDLSWAVAGDPVMIFGNDRGDWEALDQSTRGFPPHDILKTMDSQDWESVLDSWCYLHSWHEWGETEDSRVWVENPDWCHDKNENGRRYFKNAENAAWVILAADYGVKRGDLRVESFMADRSTTFYLCWYQSELDEYAGCKGAIAPLQSCRDVVEGRVWGFVVEDSDGEHVDSCWGFIGDPDDCLSEGRDSAEYLEKEAREKDAIAFAAMAEASRPDMYR